MMLRQLEILHSKGKKRERERGKKRKKEREIR